MHVFENQMYVEKLTPLGGARQKLPLVFMHGKAQTGTVSTQPTLCHKVVVDIRYHNQLTLYYDIRTG